MTLPSVAGVAIIAPGSWGPFYPLPPGFAESALNPEVVAAHDVVKLNDVVGEGVRADMAADAGGGPGEPHDPGESYG